MVGDGKEIEMVRNARTKASLSREVRKKCFNIFEHKEVE